MNVYRNDVLYWKFCGIHYVSLCCLRIPFSYCPFNRSQCSPERLLIGSPSHGFSERLKNLIKNEYDEKLETHKAQLKACRH
jgi:hypothetical protein